MFNFAFVNLNRHMKFKLLFILTVFCKVISSQTSSKKVLFLGNSYTAANNLPQMVANIAASVNDTVIFDSNTPGGYTLSGHSTNTISLTKIGTGNWDFVVLQEQSQLPSFPDSQVEVEVFPYAKKLDSIINAENSCAETVFYMTWGRKNGDASNCSGWAPVCTYQGMDSLLSLRYRMMADSNEAILSPVGAVWKYIRQNFPTIELYQSDESHPSVAGTYAAACAFYTVIFRKDPVSIPYNSTLSSIDAANIRSATKNVVYDALLQWHVGEYDPVANFGFSELNNGQIDFSNTSTNATDYYWDFGDGTTSTTENPSHTYTANGNYLITLYANMCGTIDSFQQTILVTSVGIENINQEELGIFIFPNPSTEIVNITVGNKFLGSTLFIKDVSGKVVFSKLLNSNSLSMHLELMQGVYFISTSTEPQKVLQLLIQ